MSLAPIFCGIDGEGQGREPHLYNLLAVCSADGAHSWYRRNEAGLSSLECLEFISELPTKEIKLFSFAFGYDRTKIIQDLPDAKIYQLERPELRARFGPDAIKGPKPRYWQGHILNLQGSKLSIEHRHVALGLRRKHVVWDIFKFYGKKFVEACRDWGVGTEAELAEMAYMKAHRHEFDKLEFEAVLAYCLKECQFMGQLAQKLTQAHIDVGLELKSYHGAGSSAGAMLNTMGIKEKIIKAPEEMTHAIASAFFGGRFENSRIGVVPGPVYNFDISSAYPYQLPFLPCLEHGDWQWSTNEDALYDNTRVSAALVHYTLGRHPKFSAWGPFPYRTSDGSIAFPIESGGGWVWRAEYLAGKRAFPHVQYKGAWIRHRECSCKPFDRIPSYYIERMRIGKEGPGLVLKLGMNSCYGKLAQSVGSAMFNSWVWAGIITGGTRAQILDVLSLYEDRSNLLMIATDGVFGLEDIVTPVPLNTETWDCEDDEKSYQKRLKENPLAARTVKKPLGGWERKVAKRGLFCARPGIYFPLQPTKEDLEIVKARGVGKIAVLENHARIVEAWVNRDLDTPLGDIEVVLPSVSRFCGSKSSIHRTPHPTLARKWVYSRAKGEGSRPGHPMPHYGNWVERPVAMTFHPRPKRDGLLPDGKSLSIRRLPRDVESAPYDKALVSAEAREMLLAELEMLEQPDLDFCNYEEQ